MNLLATGLYNPASVYTSAQELLFFGKNKWIAAFLAFWGGAIGLHRFYMGHYKAGLFYLFCTILTLYALQFIATGKSTFALLFMSLFLFYLVVGLIGRITNLKIYFEPLQEMVLALMFIPIVLAFLWLGLIIVFSGFSVYLVLAGTIFTLFSLFISFRYATSSRRDFIERFYKNRSIWH
ncbi:MAG: TM2 domain-containing protein [Bacteroidia bacterium]|nr:TM2 domain-containing protein [Bacteroidia bacterium]MDW8302462.1 TM2 domain-containing protein [Bacteroidia bacterium]